MEILRDKEIKDRRGDKVRVCIVNLYGHNESYNGTSFSTGNIAICFYRNGTAHQTNWRYVTLEDAKEDFDKITCLDDLLKSLWNPSGN